MRILFWAIVAIWLIPVVRAGPGLRAPPQMSYLSKNGRRAEGHAAFNY
jgi:hypothetical protein